MNLIDFTKQLFSKLTTNDLLRRHRIVCLGLALSLFILFLIPDSESIVSEPQAPNQILATNTSAFSTSTFDPRNNLQESISENTELIRDETEQELAQDSRIIADVRSGDNLSLIFIVLD